MTSTSVGARLGRLGASFGRLVARLVRRVIPDRYEGRLDRLRPEQQHDTLRNRFRSGM